MDRQFAIYLLISLLCILAALGFGYTVRRSRKRTRVRQQSELRQSERERLAATRIANNGGKALSSGFAAASAATKMPERST
jgi:hypothetical protein